MDLHQNEAIKRGEQDSLAPIQLERMSIEEESLVKHRGRVGHLMLFAVLAVSVVGLGTQLMKKLDAREAVVSAAAGVQRIRADKLDPFLRCALPGLDRAKLNSKDSLIGAIDDYSESMGKDYARTLSRCMPMLEEVSPALAAQKTPVELALPMRNLRSAAESLTVAVNAYRQHLGAPNEPYDYLHSLPRIEKIASAWERYEVSAKRFDDVVRATID
jgi:hypothetical protein